MAEQSLQRLLLDTDAYCKLGSAGLLADAMAVLDVPICTCGRLAALPYMLRRGGLRRKFGDYTSDQLARLAETLPVALAPGDDWLDPLATVPSIDPGEAQLLAASAEHGLLVLTGDKRGLIGVKDIPGYAQALDGHIIVLEAILAELCMRLGESTIRSRIGPVMEVDIAVRNCFSGSGSCSTVALISYYQHLAVDLQPLRLWKPPSLGAK